MAQFDEKSQKLLSETVSEMNDFRSELQSKLQPISGKLDEIIKRFQAMIEKSCEKEISQLEANKAKNESEFEKMRNDFKVCLDRHDVGVSKIMENMQQKSEEMAQRDERCIMSCANNKSDAEIKACFKNCILNTANEYSDYMMKLQPEIDIIRGKLI